MHTHTHTHIYIVCACDSYSWLSPIEFVERPKPTDFSPYQPCTHTYITSSNPSFHSQPECICLTLNVIFVSDQREKDKRVNIFLCLFDISAFSHLHVSCFGNFPLREWQLERKVSVRGRRTKTPAPRFRHSHIAANKRVFVCFSLTLSWF